MGICCILAIPPADIGSNIIKWLKASAYALGHKITLPDGNDLIQIGALWFLWGMFLSIIIFRLIVTANRFFQIALQQYIEITDLP